MKCFETPPPPSCTPAHFRRSAPDFSPMVITEPLVEWHPFPCLPRVRAHAERWMHVFKHTASGMNLDGLSHKLFIYCHAICASNRESELLPQIVCVCVWAGRTGLSCRYFCLLNEPDCELRLCPAVSFMRNSMHWLLAGKINTCLAPGFIAIPCNPAR